MADTNTKTTAPAASNTIEGLMQKLGAPSLKAFAAVFDLNPVRFYTVAKQPKEGVTYDPKVFNWDAIERFIQRRIDANEQFGSIEDVVKAALVKDEELKANDGRRSSRGEGTPYGEKIEVDGKMVAKRRFANFEMDAGQLVALKKDARVYQMVLQTASHTVLRPVKSDKKDDFDGNDVIVISNGMLNMKGFGPSALESELKRRFDGSYAKELADEAAKEAAKKAEEAKAAADKQQKQ